MAEEYDGKQKVKSMLAGGFGGICVVLSGHPFDTVKVSYFFPILKKAYFFCWNLPALPLSNDDILNFSRIRDYEV